MASLSLSCSKNFCSQRKLNKIWMIPPFIRYTGTCIYLVFYAHIYISRVQSWKPLIFPGFPLAICRNFLAFFFSNKNCAYYDSPNALEASLLEFEGAGKIRAKGGHWRRGWSRCFLSCSHSTQRNSVRAHSCQVAETKNRAPKQQQRNRYGDRDTATRYSGYRVWCTISKQGNLKGLK